MKPEEIDKIENIIKNNKPEEILENILKKIEDINDKDLNITIILLFKNHFNYFLMNNIICKFRLYKTNYILTWLTLINFYSLIYQLSCNIIIIYKFCISYKNKGFDVLNTIDNLYNRFKSYFDGNFSIPYFIYRLKSFNNNEQTINEMLSRLKLCHKLFGPDFFINYKIKRMTNYQFFDSSFEVKKMYTIYIYESINKIMLTMLKSIKIIPELQENINNIFQYS